MSALGLPSVMESGSAYSLVLVLRSVSASGSGLELQSESGSASVWRSASVKALA